MVVAFVLSIVLAMHAHSLIICKLQLGLHFDNYLPTRKKWAAGLVTRGFISKAHGRGAKQRK
jgi:hypothetical protein